MREECTAVRSQSNTPLAALVLLNDPSFVEAASALVSRVEESDNRLDVPFSDIEEERKLKALFRFATLREPDTTELATLFDLLQQARLTMDDDPDNAKKLMSTGRYNQLGGTAAIELAAWTTVARVVLNLSETYTRN